MVLGGDAVQVREALYADSGFCEGAAREMAEV